jgi:hypothetical protein
MDYFNILKTMDEQAYVQAKYWRRSEAVGMQFNLWYEKAQLSCKLWLCF